MPTIAAISRDRHGDKRWKRYSSYKFAAAESVAPLVLNEIPRAALAMPIAFATQQDTVMPVAVLGLLPGQNLLVASDGHWTGAYVPAAFRSYPFLLAAAGERNVLCVDEDSGLITNGPEGERFFEGDGPAKPVAEILSFLEHMGARRRATLQVCAALSQHGLIKPWPITLKTPAGERQVEGLSCIDEKVLNDLPDDAFLELRRAGGLAVAYCHLLSLPHMSELAQLAAARVEAGTRKLPVNTAGELDLEFLNDSPLMDFSKLIA